MLLLLLFRGDRLRTGDVEVEATGVEALALDILLVTGRLNTILSMASDSSPESSIDSSRIVRSSSTTECCLLALTVAMFACGGVYFSRRA